MNIRQEKEKLSIKKTTVRTHVNNIYSKLGLFIEDFYNEKVQ